MSTTKKSNTKVLVECALLIAIATVLNVVCSFIPFLNLPFGGGFTICSMLPIVLAAYRNGTKWGLLTGFVYAVVQMLLGFKTVSAFFMPSSDASRAYSPSCHSHASPVSTISAGPDSSSNTPPGVPKAVVTRVHGSSSVPQMRTCAMPSAFSMCAASSRGVMGASR